MKPIKICSIPECGRKNHAREFCNAHYLRWKQYGTPRGEVEVVLRGPANTERRFWEKVTKTAGCWMWNAHLNENGYGRFRVEDQAKFAHRFAFELANGRIPEGFHIDHKCHNPACVNPAHLRAVTSKQNAEHRTGPNRGSKSGVRGVSWNKASGKWVAQVMDRGRRVHIGLFSILAEAEAAVIAKRNELYTHNDWDRIPA